MKYGINVALQNVHLDLAQYYDDNFTVTEEQRVYYIESFIATFKVPAGGLVLIDDESLYDE